MMLRVENVTSSYGRIVVLRDVSLNVVKGEMVALIGSNGAGKTTLLRAISGVQPIGSGTISFDGKPINQLSAHARVRAGVVQVPEGRQVFAPLPVADNLRLGAWTRSDSDIDRDLDEIYTTFPALAEKRQIAAGALSGGQQQMLAIGRALMARRNCFARRALDGIGSDAGRADPRQRRGVDAWPTVLLWSRTRMRRSASPTRLCAGNRAGDAGGESAVLRMM